MARPHQEQRLPDGTTRRTTAPDGTTTPEGTTGPDGTTTPEGTTA